jgi:hypothetical protein
VADQTAKLRQVLDDLAKIPEAVIVEAAELVEDIAKQNGGSVTINRSGRHRRYNLGAVTHYDKTNQTTVGATVFGTPTGFWVWKTSGTRGGYSIPKRKPRQGSSRYMYGAGFAHPVRGQIRRKGRVSGRGAWTKVRARAEREVPQVFIQAVHDAVKVVQ